SQHLSQPHHRPVEAVRIAFFRADIAGPGTLNNVSTRVEADLGPFGGSRPVGPRQAELAPLLLAWCRVDRPFGFPFARQLAGMVGDRCRHCERGVHPDLAVCVSLWPVSRGSNRPHTREVALAVWPAGALEVIALDRL